MPRGLGDLDTERYARQLALPEVGEAGQSPDVTHPAAARTPAQGMLFTEDLPVLDEFVQYSDHWNK